MRQKMQWGQGVRNLTLDFYCIMWYTILNKRSGNTRERKMEMKTCQHPFIRETQSNHSHINTIVTYILSSSERTKEFGKATDQPFGMTRRLEQIRHGAFVAPDEVEFLLATAYQKLDAERDEADDRWLEDSYRRYEEEHGIPEQPESNYQG